MTLPFVTGNKHKFEEISAVLEEFEIEIEQNAFEISEYETANLKNSAIEKAKSAFAKLREPLIVEDTGVYFEAFNDFPGTKPKWIVERIGLEGLLKLISGKDRKAYFHTIICFIESPLNYKLFEAKFHGKISKKIVKPNSKLMPYEKIFIPEGSKKTLSEISREEKNSFSHRAEAARLLGHYLHDKDLHELLDRID